ncbi:MAG: hypothetical protein NXI24_12965 [bacterium]|nr:hypothetical protein [bacterium]
MSPTLLILFQLVILVPFVAGTLSRRRLGPQPEFSRRLVRMNLIAFEPLIVFWATWGLRLDREQIFLPIVGFAIVAAGFFFGRIFAPLLGLSGKRRAVYLISASLGNHGFTLCASLCYLWLGEEGLGLAAIFTFYFTPYVFLVIFPYAHSAARDSATGDTGSGAPRPMDFLRGFLSWNYLPLYATLLALLLLFTGVERPAWDLPVVVLLVPTVAAYYLTLGLSFDSRDLNLRALEVGVFAVIKFMLVPAFTALCITLVEATIGAALSPAVRQVLWIMSFAPAATYSVVAAVLYDLDQDYAGNLFVTNVLIFLFLVLPCLAFQFGA